MAKKANKQKQLTIQDIDCHISNADLVALPEVQEAINNDSLVVFDVMDSKNNEDFVNVFFVGKVELMSSSSKLSRYAMKRLGFDTRIERAIQSMSREVAEELGIENGYVEDEAQIRVVDFTDEDDARENQSPRETSEGDVLVAKDSGEPVYRNTEVVFKDEFEGLGGHQTIQVMTEADFAEAGDSSKASNSSKRISDKEVVE